MFAQHDIEEITLFRKLKVKSIKGGVNYKFEYPQSNIVVETFKNPFDVKNNYYYNSNNMVDSVIHYQIYSDTIWQIKTSYQYFFDENKKLQKIIEMSDGSLDKKDITESVYYYKFNHQIDSINIYKNRQETIF